MSVRPNLLAPLFSGFSILVGAGSIVWAVATFQATTTAALNIAHETAATVRSHAEWIARADQRLLVIESAVVRSTDQAERLASSLTAILERLSSIETKLEGSPSR